MGLKSEKLNDLYTNKKMELEEKDKLKLKENILKEESETKSESQSLTEAGDNAPKAQVQIAAAA